MLRQRKKPNENEQKKIEPSLRYIFVNVHKTIDTLINHQDSLTRLMYGDYDIDIPKIFPRKGNEYFLRDLPFGIMSNFLTFKESFTVNMYMFVEHHIFGIPEVEKLDIKFTLAQQDVNFRGRIIVYWMTPRLDILRFENEQNSLIIQLKRPLMLINTYKKIK